MLTRILCIFFCLISSFSFAVEVDSYAFLKMTEKEIWDSIQDTKILTETSDIYSYYYIQGRIAGLMEARRIFQIAREDLYDSDALK